jgi:hypothetical protein
MGRFYTDLKEIQLQRLLHLMALPPQEKNVKIREWRNAQLSLQAIYF